jgi:plastocyanin
MFASRSFACIGAFSLAALAGQARADIVDVIIGDSFFQTTTAGNAGFGTSNTTIHVGDTVRWTWVGGRPHSTTSVMEPAEWDSGVQGAGFVFTHTFTTAGMYDYICVIHGFHDHGTGQSSGMAGMIEVLAVPTPGAAGVLAMGAAITSRRRRCGS